MLGDMGNNRAVCILLECILVWKDFCQKLHEQECIPVGCVPPAAVVVRGGSVPDPPEFPPWVWALI